MRFLRYLLLLGCLLVAAGNVYGQDDDENTYYVSDSAYQSGGAYVKFLEPDTYHYYLFDGRAGDVIDIVVIPYDGLQPELGLSSPSGDGMGLFRAANSGYDVDMRDVVLPETGQYRVRIGGNFGREARRYALVIERTGFQSPSTPTPRPTARSQSTPEAEPAQSWQVELGRTHYGCLTQRDSSDGWNLNGMRRGDEITIVMISLDDELDPYLYLLDNNSETIAANDDFDGYNAAIIDFELPYTGGYLIRADRFGRSTGSYALVVVEGNPESIDVGVPPDDPCDEVNATPTPTPRPQNYSTQGAYQPFQRGVMIWLARTDEILVIRADGTWSSYADIFREGDREFNPAINPPTNYYQPVRGFGAIWRNTAGVRDDLGWATLPEGAYTARVRIEGDGTRAVSWVDGSRYVLDPDGTWDYD